MGGSAVGAGGGEWSWTGEEVVEEGSRLGKSATCLYLQNSPWLQDPLRKNLQIFEAVEEEGHLGGGWSEEEADGAMLL